MKDIILFFSKKAQLKYEAELGRESGIRLYGAPRVNRQGVLIMVFFKAIIIFLTLMGSLDCYMSGFGIGYDMGFACAVCAAAAIVFAAANTNLIATVAVYALCAYGISDYVNQNFGVVASGVIAVINMSYKLIRTKYGLPYSDGFDEPIPDRSMTIPVLIVMGALIMGMILAFFICRFMNVMLITLVTMLPLALVLFFDGVPSKTGFAMLVGVWLLTALTKFSYKYGHIKRKRAMSGFYTRSRIYFSQICDGTAMLQTGILTAVTAALIALAAASVISQSAFDGTVKRSELKEQIDYAARDMMITTFSNFKNYKLTNIISNGILGYYGDFTPDFETDLKVTMVPYTTDRVYMRSYIGSSYAYKKNRWSETDPSEAYVDSTAAVATARALQKSGKSAKIEVENVAVPNDVGYMPYYTDFTGDEDFVYIQDDVINGSLPLAGKKTITFYPLTDESGVNSGLSEDYGAYVRKHYLTVPDSLKKPIAALCSAEGFKNDDELTGKINAYFQNNFKYDFKTGKLPWETDFVEYFLFNTKRGVCMHFASAATLIYRSMGVPARYVEGYCVDYPQLLEGTELKDSNITDWISGIQPLGKGVMQAELSDYNAHAWVEIYKDDIGWVPVDPTPYVDPDELDTEKKSEEKESVLVSLMDYLNKFSAGGAENDALRSKTAKAVSAVAVVLLFAAAALLLWFIVLRPLVWAAVRLGAEKRGDIRSAAAMEFERLRNTAVFCKLADENVLYRELCGLVAAKGMDRQAAEELFGLTQRAIYSKSGITDREYVKIKPYFAEARRIMLKTLPLCRRIAYIFTVVK